MQQLSFSSTMILSFPPRLWFWVFPSAIILCFSLGYDIVFSPDYDFVFSLRLILSFLLGYDFVFISRPWFCLFPSAMILSFPVGIYFVLSPRLLFFQIPSFFNCFFLMFFFLYLWIICVQYTCIWPLDMSFTVCVRWTCKINCNNY